MANENVFEKELVDERDKGNLESLLEQLNLPPAAVKFVREHNRAVKIGAVLIVVAVVSWSLYDSYSKKRIEASQAALSAAMQLEEPARLEELGRIADQYASTSAALWAEIEKARSLLQSGDTEDALKLYQQIRDEAGADSLLYPLLTIGVAQSQEILKQFDQAAGEYKRLENVEGFQELAYTGQARVYEQQGDIEQALQTYQQYLLSIQTVASPVQKAMIEEKIARLQANK